jgi:hypothetical protein
MFKRIALALLATAAIFTTVGCRHNRCSALHDCKPDCPRDF